MRVLILGANGLLGHAVFRVLGEASDLEVFGTARSADVLSFFPADASARIIAGCDVEDHARLATLMETLRPSVVINCVSLSRRLLGSNDPLRIMPIYAVLPHRLAALTASIGARLVHISSDAVFSGSKGGYTEDDPPDPQDLYGGAKLLGEVEYRHSITLRTSMIGHELQGAQGLLEWFLSQQGHCKCYSKAIFSGLTTLELGEVIRRRVLPHPELCGVYHVAARAISKYDLLRLVAAVYGKDIEIEPNEDVVIDRSLNAQKFGVATGYIAPDWPALIQRMHTYHRTRSSRESDGSLQ